MVRSYSRYTPTPRAPWSSDRAMKQFTAVAAATLLGCTLAAPVAPSSEDYAGSYDMPLTWSSYGWLGEWSVGTPAQKMTAFVDWTWISLYALTAKCKGSLTQINECFLPGQEYFNTTLSSSFKNETALYPSRVWDPNHFYNTLPIKVEYASDIVRVGPTSAQLVLEAADFQFMEPVPFPFDSVYGLSPVLPGDNGKHMNANCN